MPRRFVISRIIGTGVVNPPTTFDPYRAKIQNYGVKFICVIPSNADGSPKFNWTLAMVNATAAEFLTLAADPQIRVLPAFATLDDPLTAGQRAAAVAALGKLGVATSIASNAATIRDLVQGLHDLLQPAKSVESLSA